MAIIRNKKSSIDEVIDTYSSIRNHFSTIMEKTLANFAGLDQNKDTRVVSLKLIVEPVQTNIILLHLIKDNFGTLPIWDNQPFKNNDERNEFLNNRLYFILGDLREGLFINVFLRFESFMKIVAASIGINGERINTVCKAVIDNTGVNPDFKNLIDLFTYSRNTIHSEGFHTRNTVTVTFKGRSFDFVKDSPLLFYDLDFLAFMLMEVGNLMEEIINSGIISGEPLVEHSYANLTFEYE
jgi:hypothetical protein